MEYVKVAELPADLDPAPLSRKLAQRGVEHDLIREGGVVALYVDAGVPPGEVLNLVEATLRELRAEAGGHSGQSGLAGQFQRTPAMMICLGLSLVGALVAHWHFELLQWLTFQDFRLLSPSEIVFGTFSEAMAAGQYWRLITPIFIHFGLFHIAFNGLWLWEFGRRVEMVAGTVHFVLLVAVAGVISNLSQYLWSGPSLFGGMSGVLYALLGYIWIRHYLAPHPLLELPRGILGFMLFWLVLCMSGLVDLVFGGSIANAAHVSGLLAGMFLGGLFGLVEASGKR